MMSKNLCLQALVVAMLWSTPAGAVPDSASPESADGLGALRSELSARLATLLDPNRTADRDAAKDRASLHVGGVRFESAPAGPDGQARFAVRGARRAVSLVPDGLAMVVGKVGPGAASGGPRTLKLSLSGANRTPKLGGESPLAGRAHYFPTSDPKSWHTDAQIFERVRYEAVYPGVDMLVYGTSGEIEYDFVVAPGADPSQIVLAFEGADELALATGGGLIVRAGEHDVQMLAPVVYQKIDGARRTVTGRYALVEQGEEQRVAFVLGDYDRAQPLVIDPVLSFGTFLGGSGHDLALDVATDNDGFIYVVGLTLSADFPLMNPIQSTPGAGFTVFVSKLDPSGSELIYSSYLGNSGQFDGFEQMAIAVSPTGVVHMTGETDDPGFPTVNALWPQYSGSRDAFVLKLDSSGSQILYSTFLGGSGIDLGRGIALEAEGAAYVFGITYSADFPVIHPTQPFGGGSDAFLTKFTVDGLSTVSTYLGGSGTEFGYDIVSDQNTNGFVYVTGLTDSPDFPTTPGAFQKNAPPGRNAFVAKLRGPDATIVFASFLGGSDNEEGLGIAIDRQGRPHVAGWTLSTDFPTANPVQASNGGGFDAYVARLSADGAALEFGTYLGGTETEFAYAVAVQDDESIHFAGTTQSVDFPTAEPIQPALMGTGDAFIARVDPAAGSLIHSTYLGGGGIETTLGASLGLALDDDGNAAVALLTSSASFPTHNAIQPVKGAGLDAAVVKIGSSPEVILRTRDVAGSIALEIVIANGSSTAQSMELKLWVLGDESSSDLGLINFPLSLPALLKPQIVAFSLPASLPPQTTRLGARLVDQLTGTVLSESMCLAIPCH